VEGTDGEGGVGFGALSRLAAAATVFSVTRVSSAEEEVVEEEEEEEGLVL